MTSPASRRIIFMGTPAFALPALGGLHTAGYTIAAVYTAPPKPARRGQKLTLSPVHQKALEYGLAVETPTSLKSLESQARFSSYQADVAVVAAYGLLLPSAILHAPDYGCINIHPSLLPRWRGAAPIQRTILAGDTETGVCIMQMNEGLDTGDVLACDRCTIADGTTAGALHDQLAQISVSLLITVMQQLYENKAQPLAQSSEGITYASKITRDDMPIDWQRDASMVRQHILGLNPSPGALASLRGVPIKIFNAELALASENVLPGYTQDDELTIRCGKGALRIAELQPAGKRVMHASEFLAGHTVPAGTCFIP